MLKIKYWILMSSLIFLEAFGLNVTLAQELNGAGSSFPAPLYKKWADAYFQKTGVQVNYFSVDSRAGVRQIIEKAVDFGATDIPLSNSDLKKNNLIQFPVVIGGVVPVVNLTNVNFGDMRLTGEVLSDIYLGKIIYWSDPAIKALNPDLELPSEKISVVYQAEGSGTSFIFANYLSKVSPIWRKKISERPFVKWPLGIAAKGNEGVSALVARLPNSIGYVEYTHAIKNQLVHVALRNFSDQFVQPNDDSFAAAAKFQNWHGSFLQIKPESVNKESWPIVSATYILLFSKFDNQERGREVLKFFDWTLSDGDKYVRDLDCVPVDEKVKNNIKKYWRKSFSELN